jgi:hypothetical protein
MPLGNHVVTFFTLAQRFFAALTIAARPAADRTRDGKSRASGRGVIASGLRAQRRYSTSFHCLVIRVISMGRRNTQLEPTRVNERNRDVTPVTSWAIVINGPTLPIRRVISRQQLNS